MTHRTRHDAVRLLGRKRRAVRDRIAGRDGLLCHYCRRPFGSLYAVTLDHYIPHSLMPGHELGNLVLACEPCNHTKQDALPLALAWLLLVRSAGVCVPPLALFTADWPVFRAAFTAAARARTGQPVATDRGRAFTMVFTLTVPASTPDSTGVQSGPRPADQRPSRRVERARAVVPTDRRGRVVTWRNAARVHRLAATESAMNTSRPDADPEVFTELFRTPWADPAGPGWTDRPGPTGRAVNTDPRPVNTPPGIGTTQPGHRTGPNALPPTDRLAVNTTALPVNTPPAAMNTGPATVNTGPAPMNTELEVAA